MSFTASCAVGALKRLGKGSCVSYIGRESKFHPRMGGLCDLIVLMIDRRGPGPDSTVFTR